MVRPTLRGVLDPSRYASRLQLRVGYNPQRIHHWTTELYSHCPNQPEAAGQEGKNWTMNCSSLSLSHTHTPSAASDSTHRPAPSRYNLTPPKCSTTMAFSFQRRFRQQFGRLSIHWPWPSLRAGTSMPGPTLQGHRHRVRFSWRRWRFPSTDNSTPQSLPTNSLPLNRSAPLPALTV
jgi:hypothetical protein